MKGRGLGPGFAGLGLPGLNVSEGCREPEPERLVEQAAGVAYERLLGRLLRRKGRPAWEEKGGRAKDVVWEPKS